MDQTSNGSEEQELHELLKVRREKLAKLKDMGIDPYPYNYPRTHSARNILDRFGELEKTQEVISVAGRLMSLRLMGKSCFAHIQDATGRIQVYFRKDVVGADAYEIVKLLDIGDHIGVEGTVFRTKTGEITVRVERFQLLAKNLRPLPIVKEKDGEVYDAFTDKEARYRQRYIDLIVNPQVRKVFEARARLTSLIRVYLDELGFIEVETPILQPLYGGALARPFTTYHNVLEKELFLRIADELYLKRLIVGGFERVYEIGKDFRNEGMDRAHNPEFTMLELYAAYEDYTFCMTIVEGMMAALAVEVTGDTKVNYEGKEYDLKPPWKRHRFFDLLNDAAGKNIREADDGEIAAECVKAGLKIDASKAGRGKLMDKLFGALVEPELAGPCFVLDYPVEISPLAKKHRRDPGLVERFEGFLAGREFCNAFSELNDPLDQRERFEAQVKLKSRGDEETQPLDRDFLTALEIGMPPTAGLGVGIDRLAMFFTDQHSIRDVILFPQMR